LLVFNTFISLEKEERFENRRDVRGFRGFNNTSTSKRILNKPKKI